MPDHRESGEGWSEAYFAQYLTPPEHSLISDNVVPQARRRR